jgi:hypothetical protein
VIAHNKLRIQRCKFRNTTGPAILLAPNFNEGPTTRDVTIESSSFSGCHYVWAKQTDGSITIDGLHDFSYKAPIPDHAAQNVLIANNVFESCATAAMSCRSVDELIIRGNQVGKTWTNGDSAPTPRAMILAQLFNSEITGNTSSVPNQIVIERSKTTTVKDNKGFEISQPSS